MRLLALCLLLIVAGCKSGPKEFTSIPQRPQPNRTSTMECVRLSQLPKPLRIAEEAAMKDGRLLSRYKPPSVDYDRKDDTWFVFYKGKVLMPGNHFSVTIKDNTGESTLRPGA